MAMLKQELYSYWQKASRREQIILGAGGCLIVAILLWTIIVLPISNAIKTETRINQTLNKQLREASSLAKILSPDGKTGTSTAGNRRAISQLISASVKSQQLVLSNYRPLSSTAASQSASISYDNIEFSRLLTWIGQIESDGILVIDNASIQGTESSGRVNASFIIRVAANDEAQ